MGTGDEDLHTARSAGRPRGGTRCRPLVPGACRRPANTIDAMRRDLRGALSVLLGVSAVALLLGCGSQTKTVTVAAPTSAQPTGTASSAATTPSSTSQT